MGRKPFPIRGTNFAQERGRFNRSKRKLQADAYWWEPPSKMDEMALVSRMDAMDVELRSIEFQYRNSTEEFRREMERFREGRPYRFENKYQADKSVSRDKDINTAGLIYYQDKAGVQVVALKFNRGVTIPDTLQVETDYGDTLVVYRREYIEFLDQFDEWERRAKYIVDDEVPRKRRALDRTRQREFGGEQQLDPWKTRLNLIMEAANV